MSMSSQNQHFSTSCRRATHAGSWYTDNARQLDQELGAWLKIATENLQAEDTNAGNSKIGARAIIAPHAGYAYSGETAAYAYSCVDWEKIDRVFLLGPSHHVYLEDCAFSAYDQYATPLGPIEIDRGFIQSHTNAEIDDGRGSRKKLSFSLMKRKTDEDEHSLEMHLPYIVKSHNLQTTKSFKLVPVLVGNITEETEENYGRFFAQFLNDEKNLFVISSDFCHWGSRFGYTQHTQGMPIHESIKNLDFDGIRLIEQQDFEGYSKYLRNSRNTICGRHPIGVLLCALKYSSSGKFNVKLKRYAQSSRVESLLQSSVSYASIAIVPI